MDARRELAVDLMLRFAERTDLATGAAPQRYLWTDAFAVCNFLGLERATGEPRWRELGLRLVEQVHRVLGRHRPDDARRGWLSGLGEAEGEAHPTSGGLRIGKPLPERAPDEPFDERLEWERDGQYLHYLTKWMHALDQVARATHQPLFRAWGRDLALVALRRFAWTPRGGGPPRLYWKLSVDLSRPLVPSMGQHDPLDGFVTCTQLAAGAASASDDDELRAAIAAFAAMIDPRALATDDPLGLGGLLTDAWRLTQLEHQGADAGGLVEPLLSAALVGLRHYAGQPDLRAPAHRRLAFRELGLAIGLAALEPAWWRAARGRVPALLEQLAPYARLRQQIETFWCDPAHRGHDTWLDHRNINDVMLATSLAPEGFLALPPR